LLSALSVHGTHSESSEIEGLSKSVVKAHHSQMQSYVCQLELQGIYLVVRDVSSVSGCCDTLCRGIGNKRRRTSNGHLVMHAVRKVIL
jgi:hypothetical protein